jgi:OmpA-OmpF porin, OOP family
MPPQEGCGGKAAARMLSASLPGGSRREFPRQARSAPSAGARAGGVALVAWLFGACAPAPPPPPAPAPSPVASEPSVFVLLPNPAGSPGGLVVTTPAGTQEVRQPGAAVAVPGPGQAPSAPFVMSDSEVQQRFGDTLAALPAPPAHFVILFGLGSSDLIGAAVSDTVEAIVRAIRERQAVAVAIVGHTDTVGDRQGNYRLGLARATRVAAMLTARGVNPQLLDVRSHGEDDLKVPTADNVPEPGNRRVEVTVR